jgi:hypothetical protein
MSESKRKILVLVEGARTDARLMERLLAIYNIDVKYEIVSYGTNIYTLYGEMFAENDPSMVDLLQILKAREIDPGKKAIFDASYSDILLIFDFDPHAPDFSSEKIRRMSEYFVESSDMGKLYLNYPMVEAFYHMSSIPMSNTTTALRLWRSYSQEPIKCASTGKTEITIILNLPPTDLNVILSYGKISIRHEASHMKK